MIYKVPSMSPAPTGRNSMILQIDDWKFDIDMERTMEYSADEAAEHCDCAYCRIFYAAVDRTYPELRPFLAQFGLDIEAPGEMDTDIYRCDSIDYELGYIVFGKILRCGDTELFAGTLHASVVYPKRGTYLWEIMPKDAECFELSIPFFRLPWVLDEPMEDVVSPANEPSFLKKMWYRLLGKAKNSDITS